MTADDMISQAAADGVHITLAPSGERLRLSGNPSAIDRWCAVLAPAHYQQSIIAAISGGINATAKGA